MKVIIDRECVKLKYSFWRDVVMHVGIGFLMIAGLIVGEKYFNKVLHEILSESEA